MSALSLLGLVGLALVDSTSMGTLVLPLVLLLAPRVHVRRYLVFLATVAGFYAVVGIVLVAAAGRLSGVAADLGDVLWLRRTELGLGVALLAVGIFGDPRRWFGRGRDEQVDDAATARSARWRDRLLGEGAGYGTMVGVGVAAALVEVASMLPFLAAVGLITAADLPAAGWVPVVLGYCLVMVLPALVLLAARQVLDTRLSGPLGRLSAFLDKHTGNAVLWVCAIVGFVLVGDASEALFA